MLRAKTLVTLRESELYFSEIEYSIFELGIFILDSDKPINT